MMNRILFLITAFLGLQIPVFAQSLSEEAAIKVASAFLETKFGGAYQNTGAGSNRYGFRNGKPKVITRSEGAVLIAEQGSNRFVLVMGDSSCAFVAGYGYTNSINNGGSQSTNSRSYAVAADSVPLPITDILKVKSAHTNTVSRNAQWAVEDGYSLPINPIVNSIRSQSDPFNRRCPYYTYDNGLTAEVRTLVGCVATAAEQVVSFWGFPNALRDSIAGFPTEHNGLIPTIPRGTKIDLDNILPVYEEGKYSDEQAAAVADLSYYLGVACRMDWGVGASGAQLGRLVEPLRRAFGYGYARYLCSYDYSQRQWFRLLLRELAAGRPVVYAGYISPGGGHAFVLDGIDADGYFHINWGYGGQYDGWFDLQVLTPQESPLEPTQEGIVMGLNHLQEALFLCPDSVEYQTGDTLTDSHRIGINGVRFLRAPDTNPYVTAEVSVTNLCADSIYAPVQFFTYTQLDSLGRPADIDYLGVADGELNALEDTTLTAYLTFTETGTRLLGLNTADSLYLSFDTLYINKANQPALDYTLQDSVVLSDAATFAVNIENRSAAYWSGRMVTYSLFEGDYTTEEGDLRHFTVLNLPPGEKTFDTVSFSNLKPTTDYTFVVRNPWQPIMQVPFTTQSPTGIHSTSDISESTGEKAGSNEGKLRKHPPIRLNHRITIEYDESTGHYKQVLSRRQ